ncbi:MAG: carboxypeptidase-like regulatory domain-containing protein [Flavobacteriales bacterium]|nr:carboxypeptidase-like regulatory domain-containing protein [Flavobacteriales bacterium]
MARLRPIPVLLFVFLATIVLGQRPLGSRVVDAASLEPLPYASVVCLRTGESVITNAEGVFRMIEVVEADTLVISYLGYQRFQTIVATMRQLPEARLLPLRTELSAVQVVGRSDAVYDLVIASGKHLRQLGKYEGKVYFELETRTAERTVEGIECFYNGSFNGANIEALDLKQGRIGLLPDKNRFVVNLNTSRGFMLLHPAESNGAFPATPLQYRSRKALRRDFELTVLSITYDTDELYHIRFTPKDSGGAFFQGELWVDARTAVVRSLQLDCDSCTRHPFQAIFPGDELHGLELHYRQTYVPWQGRSMLNTIEMEYALTYHGSAGDPRLAARAEDLALDRRMRTKGILHLYAPDVQFILPLFRYDAGQTDYRKVLSMPYDSAFWAEAPGLVPTERQLQDQALFAKEGLLVGNNSTLDRSGRKGRGFFESNYAFWSAQQRIGLKGTLAEGAYVPPVAMSTEVTANEVHLVVQLFLNVDRTDTGYRTFSATVFDGFSSYCHLDDKRNADLLLNIFFDLCEIERRRMQAALDQPGLSIERIRAIHANAEKSMDHTTGKFLKETRYGMDAEEMAQWNGRVVSELGVDNFALFGILKGGK